jgi:hypothetical protein
VIDFRYLGMEEILDLDWEDPWYSRFRNRNLKRRYDAPISAFLYVDNFEVRKEIVARPKDLQQWVDLGLAGKDTIRVEEQEEIKQRVAAFLGAHCPVTIDGRTPQGTLDRIQFVRRTLRRTGVIDPPVDLSVQSATLGVIFVYPVDIIPQEVSMPWELFGERIQRVPSVATDEAGGLPYTLAPGDSVLTWHNFLTNPSTFSLIDIAPPGAGGLRVPILSVLCALLLVVTLAGYARGRRPRRRWVLSVPGALAVGMFVLWPFARLSLPNPLFWTTRVSDTDAEAIVSGLLTNVYRAFDYRDESIIYDSLARSVSGDLLTQVYLETRKALEVQNQGGARVKVTEVTMLAVEPQALNGETGFAARCAWNVAGSVGHWGHIHTRTNRYDATFTIKPVDGVWKLTDLELLEQHRVSRRDPFMGAKVMAFARPYRTKVQ